ncbi:MAG: DUF4129 domain-containing protein [Chloroflexi bacterium]|nr:DUF4129 domain-containing protein [Chloroflexota bacterium]
MARTLSLIAVVLTASLLEGLWAWLLGAALSEFDGQSPPVLPLLIAIPFTGWLLARVLTVSRVRATRRLGILVAGGFLLAFTAATVHAGLLVPLQLILGHPDPDYRGSAVVIGILVGYLWARGLGLAAHVDRRQVVSHIVITTFALANILLVLPLTLRVRESGIEIVAASFCAALLALLLVQSAEAESHELSKLQWSGLAAGAATVILIGAGILTGILTGILSSGIQLNIGQAFAVIGNFASPITNGVLLGVGYAAMYLTYFLLWLRYLYGADPQAAQRAQQEAEAARPEFNAEGPYGPPEIMTLFTVLVVVGLLAWWAASVYARLAQAPEIRKGSDVRETRQTGHLDGLFDALGRIPILGSLSDRLIGRTAEIRRHYRTFQGMMARASIPRAISETPEEYRRAVVRHLPGATAPVSMITDAYSVARYADPNADLADPKDMAQALHELRTILQTEEERSP